MQMTVLGVWGKRDEEIKPRIDRNMKRITEWMTNNMFCMNSQKTHIMKFMTRQRRQVEVEDTLRVKRENGEEDIKPSMEKKTS